MKKLYLVGIENHFQYKKEYCRFITGTGAKNVFIEETKKSWKDSCQKKMYNELIRNGMKLIPIHPKKDFNLDDAGISFLELSFARNIKKNLEDKDYCFTVGGMHLSQNKDVESPLEFALKAIDCNISIVYNNFLNDYPKNYEKTIENRKKIIACLIQENSL